MARVPSQSNGQCVLQGVGRSSRFVEMCMTTGTRMTKSRLEGRFPWRWLAFSAAHKAAWCGVETSEAIFSPGREGSVTVPEED